MALVLAVNSYEMRVVNGACTGWNRNFFGFEVSKIITAHTILHIASHHIAQQRKPQSSSLNRRLCNRCKLPSDQLLVDDLS